MLIIKMNAILRRVFEVCLICTIFIGCATSSDSQSGVEWHELDREGLRKEVEQKSGKTNVWHYSGSNNSHHYFFRSPGRVFIGRYFYCKVPKLDLPEISIMEEVQFDGNGAHRSFAFTKRDPEGHHYVHSLLLGLVEGVLKDATDESK